MADQRILRNALAQNATIADPFAAGTANCVTSSVFLVLKTQDLTSEVFVCPSSSAERANFNFNGSSGRAGAQEVWNFTNSGDPASVISYSYIVPFPTTNARNAGFKLNFTLSSDFAIAADMGVNAAGTLAPNAMRAQIVAANSPNHAGDGQNVLYGDGHVDWSQTPFCGMPRRITGVPRDNIYAYGVDAAGKPSAGHCVAPNHAPCPAFHSGDSTACTGPSPVLLTFSGCPSSLALTFLNSGPFNPLPATSSETPPESLAMARAAITIQAFSCVDV